MSIQDQVGIRTSYKFNASGNMSPNAEADTASIPGASGAQQLRRVSDSLSLTKDIYRSNEIRTSRQNKDVRHGVRRVSGEIGGELSPGTYWEFIEACLRGTEVAEFSKTNTEFTSMAADNGAGTFTAGGSTWAAEGFFAGDVIRFANLSDADNNAKNFLILGLNGAVATVTPAPDSMTADTAFTVTRVGKKVSIPQSGHVKRLVTWERYHEDNDIAELFTECRVNKIDLNLPATGLSTISIGLTGRGKQTLSDGDAPYFTSPTAQTSTGIAAAVNGVVRFNDANVGVITGIQLSMEMPVDAQPVLGQNFLPDIILGKISVTGTLTALFTDTTFLDAFEDETEVEIILMLTTTTAANSPFVTVTMPRVKLSGANNPLQGEGALSINCPFEALEPDSTAGIIQSAIAFNDSAA